MIRDSHNEARRGVGGGRRCGDGGLRLMAGDLSYESCCSRGDGRCGRRLGIVDRYDVLYVGAVIAVRLCLAPN